MNSVANDLAGRLNRHSARIADLLAAQEDVSVAMGLAVAEIVEATDCEAAWVRVRDRRGRYPRTAYAGMSEVSLSHELLRPGCLCEIVASSGTDPERPCFSKNGGFWTNSLSEATAGETLPKKALGKDCGLGGFESAGIFPMRSGGATVGLLSVGDRRAGRLGPDILVFLERVAALAGAAIGAAGCREECLRLRREFDDRRRGSANLVVMSEIASSLAHDLKNPLASMMLSANRLSRLVKGDEKAGPLAQGLCDSVRILGDTVTRVTDSLGHPRLRLEPVVLNDVLEDALCLVAPEADRQGVEVICSMDERLPPVSADAGVLRGAFLNLLANALEAMSSGGRLGVVTRMADGGAAEVVVTDTGPGIAPDVADRLFKPFVTTRPGGVGLGLSVVRRIAELHRGSVSLGPGREGGAEAVLRMPLADAGKA